MLYNFRLLFLYIELNVFVNNIIIEFVVLYKNFEPDFPQH